MERIETLNLKTETDALEAGHGITLYTFDEYGRLMHYAHIVASTPKEREDGYADYFLTIFKGGDDMRRFDPDDGNDYPNFESIIESIKTIWSNTPIWWERDGSVPGVDAGITLDELRARTCSPTPANGSKTKCAREASNRTANRPSRTLRPSDRPD